MTAPLELIRVPSKRYPNPYGYRVGKYDYATPGGRWHIQQHGGCRGGWKIIDLTGGYDATIARTLAAAKEFIAECGA